LVSRKGPILVVLLLAIAGAAYLWRAPLLRLAGEAERKPAAVRAPAAAPVGAAAVERRAMPVRVDAVGVVQTIASVALRSRVDSAIDTVHFADGAEVKAGDLLFSLDSREIAAQLRQAEATLERDQGQLAFAEREVTRNATLAARDVVSQEKLDQVKTNVATLTATIKSDQATIDNLKVQLDYYTIRAPIDGRTGIAAVKAGNLVRSGDALPLVTLNQMRPIYVAFAVPQRMLAEVRAAHAAGAVAVTASAPGFKAGVEGRVTVVDNAVDPATGMISLRATFDNADEVLWPGTTVTVRMVLRVEADALVVPATAIMDGPSGTLAYVIAADRTVAAKPVTVARIVDGLAVVSAGLAAGEQVVTDGQLRLANGMRVEIKPAPAPGA